VWVLASLEIYVREISFIDLGPNDLCEEKKLSPSLTQMQELAVM